MQPADRARPGCAAASRRPSRSSSRARPFGRFPVGVWGPPQDAEQPQGAQGRDDRGAQRARPRLPRPRHRAAGPRSRTTRSRSASASRCRSRAARVDVAQAAHAGQRGHACCVTAPATVDAAFATAGSFLGRHAPRPTALAALRGERQAPPLLGHADRRARDADATTVIPDIARAAAGQGLRPLRRCADRGRPAVGARPSAWRVGAEGAAPRSRAPSAPWRTAPPTLAAVEARAQPLDRRAARADRHAGSRPCARNERVARSAHADRARRRAAHRGGARRDGAGRAAPVRHWRAPLADVQRRAGGRHAAAARAPRRAARRCAARRPARPWCSSCPTPTPTRRRRGRARSSRWPARRRAWCCSATAGSGSPTGCVGPGAGGRARSRCRAAPSASSPSARARRGARAAAHRPGRLARRHCRCPYAGQPTAIGPGCVVHASASALALHRRAAAMPAGSAAPSSPAASARVTHALSPARRAPWWSCSTTRPSAGDQVDGRQLLLGLDGATARSTPPARERAPVLLTMDNRSVLAYDVVPDGATAPVVGDHRQPGRLVAGGRDGPAPSSMPPARSALVAARGLDAALQPLRHDQRHRGGHAEPHRLDRPDAQPRRARAAKARAQGGVAVAALMRRQAAHTSARAPDRTKPGKPGGRR